jgi:hypothetical protein
VNENFILFICGEAGVLPVNNLLIGLLRVLFQDIAFSTSARDLCISVSFWTFRIDFETSSGSEF